MVKSSPYSKEKDVYGFQTLYREIGYYIARLERYEKSLKYYDEALRKTPNDKRALRGRSIARAKACQYQGALDDINKALQLSPDDLVILADRALYTYLSCEFESGFVQNSRLVPLRQKPDHFVMGVMHCSNAIENCIGERAGRPLRDHFKIIRRLAWTKIFESQKSEEKELEQLRQKRKKKQMLAKGGHSADTYHALRTKAVVKNVNDQDSDKPTIKDSLHSHKSEKNIIPPYINTYPFRPLQNYTTNIENYMAEKYLDSMYLDKIFLKTLYQEPIALCPNEKGSEKIRRLAKMAYTEVSYKQELLRTRRPFYYIKFQEATSKGALKNRQLEELLLQQQVIKKEADVLLTKLEEAYNDRQFTVIQEIGEKLRAYCEGKPKRLLPDKDRYMNEICKFIRKGYFQLNRLNEKQYIWDQNKRIYRALGLPVSREPSTDSVVGEFREAFVDSKKQIEIFESRLHKSEDPEEICWCYLELCKNYVALKRWELARMFGKKCIQDSKSNKSLEWIINACMILAKSNIQQHNQSDAKNEINYAMSVAEELQDENLKKYLTRCLEVIDTIEFDSVYGPQIIEKRQNKILSMMGSLKMKDELSHIFRTMQAMPASRRLSIMPGIRVPEAEAKKTTPLGRRMSIMPSNMPIDEGIAAKAPMAAKKKEKPVSSKGVEFLDLVQYHIDVDQ